MTQHPATSIIWLPSYPRSGNTWLRFLLTNLFYTDHATQEDADLFIDDQVDQLIAPKDGNPGRDFSVVNPENFLAMSRENLMWSDRFLRTHHAWDQVCGLLPQTIGFIYVVRHPLDVALSCFDYDLLGHPTLEREQWRDRYIRDFIQTRGGSSGPANSYGINWVHHVESWVESPEDLPGIVLRYEDMLADTAPELRRICDFLGIEISEEAIATAIDQSSFSQMRKIEDKAIESGERGSLNNPDRFEKRHQEGYRFVNRGQSGVYRDSFTPEELELAAQYFSPIAQKFGYTFDA